MSALQAYTMTKRFASSVRKRTYNPDYDMARNSSRLWLYASPAFVRSFFRR